MPDRPPDEELHVLLIDDDEEDALLVRDVLDEAKGIRFHVAYEPSPERGLAELRANAYDVYLLDYQLGPTDGLTVLEEAIAGGCIRPVILLTGQSDFELGRAALTRGAADYLVKGRFDPDLLQRTIRYAVERKRFVQRLREMNTELERRVEERTADLTRANRELEAFSYSVSHDLRAPLRAISATSQILLEDFGAEMAPEAKRLLERQSRAAIRLGALIDDLLVLARVGRERPDLQRTDLSVVARAVVEDLPLREGDEVTIAPDVWVMADPGQLRRVLQNLLDNAAKFRAPDRPLRLWVEADRRTDEVEVTVRDNGVGFDMAFEPKVWEPFHRLVRDEEVPGTGVGLATVRRIVEAHGGRTWVNAAPDVGAAFSFTLPASAPESPPADV
jgi:signal transduction histidine kinase